jgi:Predicted metal-dependent protease of the PAD1/JAB1 superfamily
VITLSHSLLQDILTHAALEEPNECCGVLVVEGHKDYRYIPLTNATDKLNRFAISPRTYTQVCDNHDVVAIVHSHVLLSPKPSECDLVEIERTKKPFVIVNWPTGQYTVTNPSGYKAPLIGRPFVHGVLDCYSLIRDYYAKTFNIILADFDRDDEWWHKGQNLYLENFENQNFVDMGQDAKPQMGDVILMQVLSPVPNHGAIYFSDNVILQHITNRLSGKDVYGGYWRKNTTHILRHKTLL